MIIPSSINYKTIRAHQTFYSLHKNAGLRTTNFIFKKDKPKFDIEINCVPTLNSKQAKSPREMSVEVEASTRIKFHSFKSNQEKSNRPDQCLPQSPTETSCTNFMKSYIEKLKKERKRQNKKMLNSKTEREKSRTGTAYTGENLHQFKFDDTVPLSKMKQPNQILILERVPQNGKRGLMNTISVVSEDLYQDKRANSMGKDKKQPAWANKQKIDQIIRDIRNSRNKISGVELFEDYEPELGLMSQTARADKLFYEGQLSALPRITERTRRQKRVSHEPKKMKVNEFNLKSLEPWKIENHDQQQFTIDFYDRMQDEDLQHQI